jgi:membrane-bound metal-dependent hydrolase YbcI (DUF457 family)
MSIFSPYEEGSHERNFFFSLFLLLAWAWAWARARAEEEQLLWLFFSVCLLLCLLTTPPYFLRIFSVLSARRY